MALLHAILGFLEREPMTGYDLKTRCFDADAGHLWTADQAQVYRTLDRLEADGLVKSRLIAQRGKPDRRVYSVTQRGRAILEEWLATTEDPAPLRDPFLMHLFFAGEAGDDRILTLLARAREVYQDRLDDLRSEGVARLEEYETSTGRARDAELRRMTLAAGMASARTFIDWIDDCVERVRSGLPNPSASAATEGEQS